MKYLDFESSESNPLIQAGTQPVVIQREMAEISQTELSVCTPLTEQPAGSAFSCNSRENLHLLMITDDMSFINAQINILKQRGVKIANFPSMYDISILMPFLLINDHSILIVKNPRKDILGILKQIIRSGQYNKQKINLTIWVIIDITIWLDKMVNL